VLQERTKPGEPFSLKRSHLLLPRARDRLRFWKKTIAIPDKPLPHHFSLYFNYAMISQKEKEKRERPG
jgi:hypothetical protein